MTGRLKIIAFCNLDPPVTSNLCRHCGGCAYCGAAPVGHRRCKARPRPGDVLWGPAKQHEAECKPLTTNPRPARDEEETG